MLISSSPNENRLKVSTPMKPAWRPARPVPGQAGGGRAGAGALPRVCAEGPPRVTGDPLLRVAVAQLPKVTARKVLAMMA